MDRRRAMYIVNKKTKEIRDIMRLCRNIDSDDDEVRRKSFFLLMRLLYGRPGAGKRLAEIYKELRTKKNWLYQLKYTVVHRDGKPVDVTLKPVTHNGMPCSELTIIYEYETDLYHLPATEDEVDAAGLVMPKSYTDAAGSMTQAPWDPIPDEDLEEAVYTIMKVLGDDPLQTPPDNIMKELFSRGKNILKT